jgi:hypothetical protein
VLVPQLEGLALLLEVGPHESIVVGAGDASGLSAGSALRGYNVGTGGGWR